MQIFNNPQFGEIRVLGTPNAPPLFCAMDLCKALGYANGRDAVLKHCDSDDVVKCDATDSMGRKQQLTYKMLIIKFSPKMGKTQKVEDQATITN